jgi:hypothetical protein
MLCAPSALSSAMANLRSEQHWERSAEAALTLYFNGFRTASRPSPPGTPCIGTALAVEAGTQFAFVPLTGAPHEYEDLDSDHHRGDRAARVCRPSAPARAERQRHALYAAFDVGRIAAGNGAERSAAEPAERTGRRHTTAARRHAVGYAGGACRCDFRSDDDGSIAAARRRGHRRAIEEQLKTGAGRHRRHSRRFSDG